MIGTAFENVKWGAFVLFDLINSALAHRRQSTHPPTIHNHSTAEHYNWVFCSTIGELNACRPFIDHINRLPGTLVFLTDRHTYKDSYHHLYPDAIIVELTGALSDHRHLIKLIPPRFLVVCEIPCALHDAPCRLSYGLLGGFWPIWATDLAG